LLDSRDSLAVSQADRVLYREILALTALFTDDYALATELGGMLDSTSPVLRYIQSIQPLFENRVDQESAEEIQNALATWETGEDEDQGVMKANAQGYVLARLGLRAQAYSILSNALRQWPGNGVGWRNLASMYRLANMPKYRVASLRQLLATKGNNPEALRLLFTALLDSGMEREAQTFAESTYALMPNDPEAIANLAQAYLRADKIPVAIQVLERAVANQPDEAILVVTLGVARLRAGDAQGALDALDGAGSDPDWTLAAMELGAFSEAHMGNWDRALNKIGSVADDSLSLKTNLLKVAALLHMDEAADAVSALPADDMLPRANLRNKVAESVFVLRHALGEEADLTEATAVRLAEGLREGPSGTKLFAYGLALQEAQLYEHAYTAFNELYTTMEDQPRLITFVFDSLSQSGTLDDRQSTAEALAAAHDAWPESLLGLAKVYRAEGDSASQQDALVQATALAPDNIEAWQILAEFAGRQGDEALSLVAYEHLIGLEPNSPIVLNNLAYYILKMEGDAQVALEYASKANELMGGVSAFIHTLGLAQLRVGDLESSQANLTQALSMQPGDPTLTLDFGQLLIKLGRVDEGKRAVQSALDYAKALDVEFPRSAEAEKILAEE